MAAPSLASYELEVAYRERRAPCFGSADVAAWVSAIYGLLVSGRISIAEHAVRSLGPTRDATLASLRRFIAFREGRRVVCIGNSAGGFAALDYGLALGADAVLCIAGQTNLTPDFNVRTVYEKKTLALKSQF